MRRVRVVRPGVWWARLLWWLGSYWFSALLPTDIWDPEAGEPLYCWAKVRPRWYWFVRRCWLFLRIVWRPACQDGGPVSVRTAWKVAGIVHNGHPNPDDFYMPNDR